MNGAVHGTRKGHMQEVAVFAAPASAPLPPQCIAPAALLLLLLCVTTYPPAQQHIRQQPLHNPRQQAPGAVKNVALLVIRHGAWLPSYSKTRSK